MTICQNGISELIQWFSHTKNNNNKHKYISVFSWWKNRAALNARTRRPQWKYLKIYWFNNKSMNTNRPTITEWPVIYSKLNKNDMETRITKKYQHEKTQYRRIWTEKESIKPILRHILFSLKFSPVNILIYKRTFKAWTIFCVGWLKIDARRGNETEKNWKNAYKRHFIHAFRCSKCIWPGILSSVLFCVATICFTLSLSLSLPLAISTRRKFFQSKIFDDLICCGKRSHGFLFWHLFKINIDWVTMRATQAKPFNFHFKCYSYSNDQRWRLNKRWLSDWALRDEMKPFFDTCKNCCIFFSPNRQPWPTYIERIKVTKQDEIKSIIFFAK